MPDDEQISRHELVETGRRDGLLTEASMRRRDPDTLVVADDKRTDSIYEVFSYNLYPGPSAKKGIFPLLNLKRAQSRG